MAVNKNNKRIKKVVKKRTKVHFTNQKQKQSIIVNVNSNNRRVGASKKHTSDRAPERSIQTIPIPMYSSNTQQNNELVSSAIERLLAKQKVSEPVHVPPPVHVFNSVPIDNSLDAVLMRTIDTQTEQAEPVTIHTADDADLVETPTLNNKVRNSGRKDRKNSVDLSDSGLSLINQFYQPGIGEKLDGGESADEFYSENPILDVSRHYKTGVKDTRPRGVNNRLINPATGSERSYNKGKGTTKWNQGSL